MSNKHIVFSLTVNLFFLFLSQTSSSSSSKEQSSSRQGPFEALSNLAAMSSKDKQKSSGSSSKQKLGLDPNKPGSFLFADPIRIGSSKTSSSKSGLYY